MRRAATWKGTEMSEAWRVSPVLGVRNVHRAVDYYTEVLGFVVKTDIPVGTYRFLTVVAPDEPAGMELLQKILLGGGLQCSVFPLTYC